VSAQPAERLPVDPAEHPIVLFDGVCNLCNGTVRFLIARDSAGRLRFASLQSELGRAVQRRHGVDPDALDTFMLLDGTGLHVGSEAMLRLFAGLPAPWRWLGALHLLPRPLRDAVYGVVVRNRYRWFGRRDECLVPTPELRARFLG
jgi:predicted DCC family thiol-disulfide oxidoreductase YuxK